MRAASPVKSLSALGLVLALSAWAMPDSPIADAAMRGDIASVRRLVKEGADVNAAQGDGMTALHWAAERGDAELVEVLIYAGANVRAGTRIGSYMPLHLASKAGSSAVVVALLKAGSDPNAATSNSGATPLHLAAGAGSVASIEALVDAGAEVNARDLEWGQTPLMHAAGWNRPAAVKALLTRGADPDLTSTAIDVGKMAAVDQMAERRKQAVLAGFRPENAPEAEWQPTPGQLEAAVREARAIQRANSADRQYQDGKLEDDQAAEYPLRVGAWGGLTALLHAVRQGHRETTIALLDGGADIDVVSAGDHTSALLMATLNGQFDLAMLLVDRGADVNRASDAGAAPLYAVLERQWAPKSRYPQPQEHEQQQTTYLDLMKALLNAGADPDARLTKHLWYMEYTFEHLRVDTKGATPFWRAAYGTDVPAMRLLIDYGADPNISTIKIGEGGFVFDDYQKTDDSGLPPIPPGGPAVHPIQAAAGAGYGEGFAANHHRHAPNGWLPAMQYLVGELGIDPNLRDQNGYTALHHAAARGDNETIEYLVSKGGDVTLVSRRGQTTADMANGPYQRIQPFPTTVALLERLGSKNNHRCMSC